MPLINPKYFIFPCDKISYCSFPNYFGEKLFWLIRFLCFHRQLNFVMFSTMQFAMCRTSTCSYVITGTGLKAFKRLDWASSTGKTYLGYLCFIFLSQMNKTYQLKHFIIQQYNLESLLVNASIVCIPCVYTECTIY